MAIRTPFVSHDLHGVLSQKFGFRLLLISDYLPKTETNRHFYICIYKVLKSIKLFMCTFLRVRTHGTHIQELRKITTEVHAKRLVCIVGPIVNCFVSRYFLLGLLGP